MGQALREVLRPAFQLRQSIVLGHVSVSSCHRTFGEESKARDGV